MIEEEKKTIEDFKRVIANYFSYSSYDWFYSDLVKTGIKGTIQNTFADMINLIEKLQNENEYLKKNQRFKKDFNGEKIFCLEYDKETLRDMVLEKQEEIKELKSNSIPKDKIREKIKEKEAEKEGVKNISLEEYAITSKELKESEICLLKSLLEEE